MPRGLRLHLHSASPPGALALLLAAALLASACSSASPPSGSPATAYELTPPSPEEWRAHVASHALCAEQDDPTSPGASITFADLGVSLALPTDATSEIVPEGYVERLWAFPDSAIVQLLRAPLDGQPQFAVQLEGADIVSESKCGLDVGGHPAVVQRIRVSSRTRSQFVGVVEIVPAGREYLTGLVIAPTAARRDSLMALLTDMRVLPR